MTDKTTPAERFSAVARDLLLNEIDLTDILLRATSDSGATFDDVLEAVKAIWPDQRPGECEGQLAGRAALRLRVINGTPQCVIDALSDLLDAIYVGDKPTPLALRGLCDVLSDAKILRVIVGVTPCPR
jgi:hypothetical protein